MESTLTPATRKAAERLIKSQMRLFVLQEKGREGNSDIWGPLAGLEEGFAHEALKEWLALMPSWGTSGEARRELLSILHEAREHVESEVASSFQGKMSEDFINDTLQAYRLSLQELLPGGVS